MSSTQQFNNLPQGTWACWDNNLVPYLESEGCTNVQFGGGDSGTLSFHHFVPGSNGNFEFTYNYNPSTEVLTLTIVESPDLIPDSDIFATVQGQIYTCPPSSSAA